jgi:hypothetical protein
MFNRDKLPLLRALPVLTFLLFSHQLPSQAQGQDTPSVPGVIDETEGRWSGTWTLNNGRYEAQWNNGAKAILTIGSFTPQSVLLNRTDTADSGSRGLTAVYTGQIASTGDKIVNGHVTWTWPGVPGYPATGTWNASWARAIANVKILLNGRDVTDTTPSVVVGQQINLAVSLSGDATCTLPMWSVEGLTVAGFEALPSFYDPKGGSAVPTDFTKPSETQRFYWVRGGAFLMTASCMSGGQTLSAQAAFNVNMPNFPIVTATTGSIGIVEREPGERWLQLGTSSTDIGIKFQTVRPSTGAYQWVQTLSIHADLLTPRGNHPIVISNELDTYYPYNGLKPRDQFYEKDYPGAMLDQNLFTKISESFSAHMFLMWNPRLPANCILSSTEAGAGTCTSISVPLGYIDWRWSGAAQYARKQWKMIRGSTSTGAGPFVQSTIFPHWFDKFTSACYPDCGRLQQTLFSSGNFDPQ